MGYLEPALENESAEAKPARARFWPFASARGKHPHEQGHASTASVRDARRDLLDEIGRFLLDNDLTITAVNLTAAHAALSGHDLVLAEAIAERRVAGKPITQSWLERTARLSEQNAIPPELVELLLEQLSTCIANVDRVAQSTREATGEFQTEMTREIAALEEVDSSPALRRIVATTRSMIEQMHHAELAMKSSHDEAAQLRNELDNARLAAEVDQLTGLANRRAFEKAIATMQEQMAACGKPFSIAFCDVDHFKRINDEFGHDTGDRALRVIARVLKETANEQCFVARHGGEEFVLLFPGDTGEEARAKVEATRQTLAARKFRHRRTEKPLGHITFSAGVAEVAPGQDAREGLTRADEALYRAKNEGRNRVELASPAS